MKIYILTFSVVLALLLTGCATTDETSQLRRSINSLQSELFELRQETDVKLSKMSKENEAMSKQVVNMYSSMESRDDKIKGLMGKIDELEYQLRAYWAETKNALSAAKKPDNKPAGQTTQEQKPGQQAVDGKYEDMYKDAFEAFQKGKYEEAIKRFSAFIESYSTTPLVSNAYYWMGESYMNLKNYEKAIVQFQEVVDRFPKSDKAARAMLRRRKPLPNSGIKRAPQPF